MSIEQKAEKVIEVKKQLDELRDKRDWIRKYNVDGKRFELVVTKRNYSTEGDGHKMECEEDTMSAIVKLVDADLAKKIKAKEVELKRLLGY